MARSSGAVLLIALVGVVLAAQSAQGLTIRTTAEPELALGCRVRHVVEDAAAFGAVVAEQRQQHLDQSFRQDSIYRELVTEEFVVPFDLQALWSQPIALGPVAAAAEWGFRIHPIYGSYRFHNGLDAVAAHGTPVAALGAGTVVIAGYRGGYGQTVLIDHGGGFSTLYAHLSVRSVTPGAAVAAGEVVGLVGSSGTATGPHLHLETRIAGVPVDPRWFVPLLSTPTGPTGSSRVPSIDVVPGSEGAHYQIERLYLAAFGRRPTSTELNHWVARCDAGFPLEGVAEAALRNQNVVARVGLLTAPGLVELSASPEIQKRLADALLDPGVRRLYLAIFGREPDVSGSYYWSARAAKGETLVSLARSMSLTAEYETRFGQLDDEAFLDQLYGLLFDRPPDSSGLAHWLDRISADGRWKVLVGFTESPEGRARLE